jgi:hypothetical protein
MTTPASLLADLRQLEAYAAAGGAPDALLTRVVPQFVALAVGVPMSSADAFLRILALVERERVSVRLACRRIGMARSHFTELRDRWHGITGHDPCERPVLRTGGSMARIVKTAPISAPDTLTPPQQANGKPTWQAPPTPRADGGMAVGKTGGNFADHSSSVGMNTPADMLDKPGTGNP